MEQSLRFWLEDEAGIEQEYEVIGTFGLDDKDYMALIPVAEDGEEAEVCLIGFHAGPLDEIILDPIEDEDELEKAAEAFDQIFNGGLEEYREYAINPQNTLEALYPDGIPEELMRGLSADPPKQFSDGTFQEAAKNLSQNVVEESMKEVSGELSLDAFESLSEDDSEEWCYEDADGNLFIYGEDGSIIYLDENGEPKDSSLR